MTGTLGNRPNQVPATPASDLDRLFPVGDEMAEILYRTTMSKLRLLRQIALDEASSMQALITEAIDVLLVSRGRLPPA